MKKYSPCYKCAKRTPLGECHNTCPGYKEYDEDNKIRRLCNQIGAEYCEYMAINTAKRRKK